MFTKIYTLKYGWILPDHTNVTMTSCAPSLFPILSTKSHCCISCNVKESN